VAEFRRGVDHATIFSVAISPSGEQLAVTSDKLTLHIFDIPHPTKAKPSTSASSRRLTSTSSSTLRSPLEDPGSNKWGILGKIPLLPRVFRDIYSFASARFEIGEESTAADDSEVNDTSSMRSQKGLIGWISEHSLLVIGAGKEGCWEKYVIAEGEDGKRYCLRDGWKKYLGSS
jgi:hypothetical protein